MTLKKVLSEISYKIQSAQRKAGFGHQVEIVGVTKTKPFKTIIESYQCGLRSIGENRVQEANKKFESFKKMPGLKKRFIGHLQTNKVKKCMDLFDTIDSVDSLKLIKKISKQAEEKGVLFPVLLEVNTSEESQKYGFLPNQIDEMLKCFDEGSVIIDGLMTIGPLSQDKQKTRTSFKQLKKLQTTINKHLGTNQLKTLSMGMSGDFEIAIEEGSTMIRVGTVLYGKRYN